MKLSYKHINSTFYKPYAALGAQDKRVIKTGACFPGSSTAVVAIGKQQESSTTNDVEACRKGSVWFADTGMAKGFHLVDPLTVGSWTYIEKDSERSRFYTKDDCDTNVCRGNYSPKTRLV